MGDNRFNAAEASAVTLSGTTTAVENGQTVTLSVSDGVTTLPFTTTVNANAWSVTVDLSSLSDGDLTVAANVTDLAGNAAPQASHTIAKDIVFPTVAVTGPTEVVTTAFDVTITFSEAVFGFDLADVTVAQGTGTATVLSGSGTTYTATIDPVLGQIVQVSIAAGVTADASGNPNTASNVYEVQAGSPASEFERYREEIKQVLVDDATRSLRSSLTSNQRMVRDARARFIAGQNAGAACVGEDQTATGNETCDDAQVTRNVPFDITGGFDLGAGRLSSSGTFFGQTGDFEGISRRLVFGDFDIQHDSATGSTTATLNGKIAWERKTSDKTMLGYFIGGELAHSSLDGSFVGDQDRVGVSVGGYAVHQLAANIYADGFVSIGAGRNNLDMANDVLSLTSDYTTRTATIGGALSGVYTFAKSEFRPEPAFSYGKTWIGTVGFTGRAYGLVDDTLSLDAGNVTLATLTLRPEVIWALDGQSVALSTAQLSFAPRLVCERVVAGTTTNDCGGGGEFGLTSHSEDGLSNAEIRVIMDRVGGSTNSSVAVNLQQRF